MILEDLGSTNGTKADGSALAQGEKVDDLLTVSTAVSSLGRAQAVFAQRIERAGEVLVEANVRVACIDAQRLRPVAIPRTIRNQLGESR